MKASQFSNLPFLSYLTVLIAGQFETLLKMRLINISYGDCSHFLSTLLTTCRLTFNVHVVTTQVYHVP